MPTYNGERTIESVFKNIPRNTLKKIYRIIIVNDGSQDKTLEKIKSLKKFYKIDLLNHGINEGYGAAQQTGLKYALKLGADIIALLHCDGQLDPRFMNRLLEPLEMNQTDIVQGSRILSGTAVQDGMPRYKYIGNIALTFLENIAFGMNLAEYHSGYMLYSKKALQTIPFEKLSSTFHFDGEMLIVAKKKGLRIKEMPIQARYKDEVSHLHIISYGVDVMKTIINYWRGKYNF